MGDMILILGEYSNKSPYIIEFTKSLIDYKPNFTVELIHYQNFKRYKFVNNEFVYAPIRFIDNPIAQRFMNTRFIGAISTIVFGAIYFLFFAPRYKLVCIHFVRFIYAFWIDILKIKSNSISSIVWGSDLFHVNPNTVKYFKRIYKRSDSIITGTKQSMEHLVKRFPMAHGKANFINFGNEKLFKKLLKPNAKRDELKAKWLDDENIDCVTISIGYNNRVEQQHEKIINSLSCLEEDVKKKIILLALLTYPINDEYKEQVKLSLAKSGIKHLIFDSYLADDMLMELRELSDVYINMQVTDMFSASVLEYMSLGSVMLNADWLLYDYIKDHNLYAHKVNWDNLSETTLNVIHNLNEEKQKSELNKNKVRELVNWESLMPIWAKHLQLEK